MSGDEGFTPDEMRRIARQAREEQLRKAREERNKRIGDRLEREARREMESQRELEDFVGDYLGASVDDVQAAFDKGAPPPEDVLRAFNKIKKAKGARRKRLVKGAPGRRVRKEYSRRRGCRIFALALLTSASGVLAAVGWGAYELVRWVA